MRRCAAKKAETLVTKKFQSEIMVDLDQLQLSADSEMFEEGVKLFFDKWRGEEKFLKYFRSEWINKNKNWYEGVRMLTPSTNNALESTNNVIKKEGTIRERLPLAKFNTILLEMVESWSARYKHNHIQFQREPFINLPLWTSSYQWVRKNVCVLECKVDNGIKYHISTSTEEPIKKQSTFDSFDNFKEMMFTSYSTFLPTESWIKGKCTCRDYMKEFICSHIVGMAIRLKLTKTPTEAKTLEIGSKRKPGRPSKAKKALVVQ